MDRTKLMVEKTMRPERIILKRKRDLFSEIPNQLNGARRFSKKGPRAYSFDVLIWSTKL